MKCLASLTGQWDKPYLVKSKEFLACVDKNDFASRDYSKDRFHYLASWFGRSLQGELLFILPTFFLEAGHAYFINGRHRTALLLKLHRVLLPMALAIRDESGLAVEDVRLDEASQITFEKIVARRIALNETFRLPCLPKAKG